MADQAPTARRRPGHGVRLALLSVAGVVAAALVALAVGHLDVARTAATLAGVRWPWAATAFALMAVAMLLRAEAWHAVLAAALPALGSDRRPAYRGTMIGVLLSAALPGRLGEAGRAVVVSRRLGDTRRYLPVVVGTIVSQTLLNLLAIALLAAGTAASLSLFDGHAGAVVGILIAPVVVIALVVGLPPAARRASRARAPRVARAGRALLGQLQQLRRGLVVFRRPGPAAHATAGQLAAWALQLLSCDALLTAFGLPSGIGLAAAAAVLLAVNVSAIVPLTPSNVGIFQAACIAVLAAYGVSAAEGLAYGIALQGIEIATALVLGVPALIAEGVSLRALRRDVGAEPSRTLG
jgi:phosphatidylinositol alpha-mannosyltransferase